MKALYKNREITTKIFSGTGNDSYTSDEQVIGQWIDGKPIYRRVIKTQTPSKTGTQTIALTNTKDWDIDQCVRLDGMMQEVKGMPFVKVPSGSYIDTNTRNTIWIAEEYNMYMTGGFVTGQTNQPFTVICEYTKNTDSPASTISTTPSSNTPYVFGHGFQQDGNTISIQTVDDFDGDNTLPMSAQGVKAIVGDVETLLATI